MSVSVATLDAQTIKDLFIAPGSVPPAAGDFPPRWVYRTVFYQIFLDRFANGNKENDPSSVCRWGEPPTTQNFFGGDLDGLIAHLDYLADLGVGGVYLNPIFLSPSNHKYDTQDYLVIDPHFGSLKTFSRLLDAAHARGIRLLLDGVFNHTGDHFWAFQHAMRAGECSPYKDWYHCHGFPLRQQPKPNYESWWGFASLPKLNVEHPEVLAYLTRVITFWTSLGIDGWRLDVPNEVAFFFWRYFRRLVREINPEAYIVGEIWEDGRPWLGGDMFDAVMNYSWRDLAVKYFATREIDLDSFLGGLAEVRQRHEDAVTLGLFNLLGSHDTARFLTVAGRDKRRLKLASLLQFTYPGVPVIYYGDEVGLCGEADPDCRRTMPWRREEQDQDLLAHYRRLGRLRKETPALQTGGFRLVHQDNAGATLAYERGEGAGRVLVVLNNSDHERRVEVPTGETRWEDMLRGGAVEPGDGGVTILLGPVSGTALRAV